MYFMSIIIKMFLSKNFFSGVTGYYHVFDDGGKTLNFILNDTLLEKICEIFSNTVVRLGFRLVILLMMKAMANVLKQN